MSVILRTAASANNNSTIHEDRTRRKKVQGIIMCADKVAGRGRDQNGVTSVPSSFLLSCSGWTLWDALKLLQPHTEMVNLLRAPAIVAFTTFSDSKC